MPHHYISVTPTRVIKSSTGIALIYENDKTLTQSQMKGSQSSIGHIFVKLPSYEEQFAERHGSA